MKHICKTCNKNFPCGRSFGGHMRSHVINPAYHHQKMKHSSLNNNRGKLNNNNTEVINGSSNSKNLGYHLRKDPKKTMICNQDSWISQPKNKTSGPKICQMKKARSNIYDEQEAEIAMCLIMLSRDVRKWDKKMMKLKKTNNKEDQIDDQNNRNFYQTLGGHKASHKKLKRCFDLKSIDKNTIKHEPMLDHDHMINGCCVKTSDDHQSPLSLDLDGYLKNTKVVGGHECSICLRVFSSGEALGGHKRSHLIAEAKLNQQNFNLVEKFDEPVHEIRGSLDLNMPPDGRMEEEEQEEEIMIIGF